MNSMVTEAHTKETKEIERLNNIIKELEKYINNEWNAIEKEPDNSFYDGYDTCIEEMKKDILDKLQELKGSNNDGQSFIQQKV